MKIILFIILTYFSFLNYAFSDKIISCDDFDKLSAKYIECKAKNLKKTIDESETKKKIIESKENIKSKIDDSETKKKISKLKLKEKLIKFKNSKTIFEFLK